MSGAIARIILRYAVGFGLGAAALGDQLAADPDVVMILSLAVGVLIEVMYTLAKKRGWAT